MKQNRPYQGRAVAFLTNPVRQRGFIVSPAGSGKTYMAAMAAKLVLSSFDKVMVLVNTCEQRQQMADALNEVGICKSVTIDAQCVAAQPDVTGADLVIIDECHRLPAPSWWATIAPAEAIVWGFSATPWSGDWERDGSLKAFFGEENFLTIPREEVQAGGSITAGKVIIHDLDEEGEFDPDIMVKTVAETAIRFKRMPYIARDEHERRVRWQFTAEAIRNNWKRNNRIVTLANNETRSTLILVSTVEHGERLGAEIPGSIVVHAKIGKKKRKAAIDAFRDGTLRVMIATSLADEGLDVPRAAVLILASGGRSAGKLEQRAGRVMRPHEGKEFGIVHDFSDRGAGLGHSQFKARMRTYKKLGYERNNA